MLSSISGGQSATQSIMGDGSIDVARVLGATGLAASGMKMDVVTQNDELMTKSLAAAGSSASLHGRLPEVMAAGTFTVPALVAASGSAALAVLSYAGLLLPEKQGDIQFFLTAAGMLFVAELAWLRFEGVVHDRFDNMQLPERYTSNALFKAFVFGSLTAAAMYAIDYVQNPGSALVDQEDFAFAAAAATAQLMWYSGAFKAWVAPPS